MARTPVARKAAARKTPEKPPQYSHRYCNARRTAHGARRTVPREFGPGMSADRARAINVLSDKWVNGTEPSCYFFDQPTDGENANFADGSTPDDNAAA